MIYRSVNFLPSFSFTLFLLYNDKISLSIKGLRKGALLGASLFANLNLLQAPSEGSGEPIIFTLQNVPPMPQYADVVVSMDVFLMAKLLYRNVLVSYIKNINFSSAF